MTNRKPKSHKSIRKHWASFFWQKKGYDSEFEFIEEKTCFACGLNWDGFDNPLEGAHIIARCNGGSDEVDNLLLLCRCCHRAQEANSIICLDREGVLKWILERTLLDATLHFLATRGANISQILAPTMSQGNLL